MTRRYYAPTGRDARKRFAALLRAIRGYFDGEGFDEVLTPNVVSAGAVESTIDVPSVVGPTGEPWGVLHSSPEITMKAWIAEAPGSLYQIARCYRDDPETGIHYREFTMLEWYRVPGTYRDVLEDFWNVVAAVAGKRPGHEELTVREALQRTTGIDIRAAESLETLRERAQDAGVASAADDRWEDIFFRLLVDRVEPALPRDRWTVLRDYPTAVSPLAAPCADDPFFAERFEVYSGAMELCNGCTELADPDELERRCASENEIRRMAGKAPHARPEGLFAAARARLPPYAGVAVGLERLFAATGG
jgi:lysyl-tRNA synthetase class 2